MTAYSNKSKLFFNAKYYFHNKKKIKLYSVPKI